MVAIEKEQWADLSWATDVVSGKGDGNDCMESATNMLTGLTRVGATQQIRHAASVTLVHGVAEVA